MRIPVALRFALTLAVALPYGAAEARGDLTTIVPAYFYPVAGSDWDELNDAATRIPVTAIVNPFNGPGNNFDPNYANVVDNLRAAGGKVIGYVYTSYGARNANIVKADIDQFVNWYNIDGIFFDEVTNTGTPGTLSYYQGLYDYAKAIDPAWEIMGNPGTKTAESYLSTPVFDSVIVHENFGSNYPGYVPDGWNYNYDPSAIGHLVHTEPSEANMLNYLDLAVARNVGQVYITDEALSTNPWDALPSYWDAMVNRIEQINNTIDPIEGDLDSDGFVGITDLNIVLGFWNQDVTPGDPLQGDPSGDGFVGINDIGFVLGNWNATAPPGAPADVPEPGAMTVLGVAAAVLLRRSA